MNDIVMHLYVPHLMWMEHGVNLDEVFSAKLQMPVAAFYFVNMEACSHESIIDTGMQDCRRVVKVAKHPYLTPNVTHDLRFE